MILELVSLGGYAVALIVAAHRDVTGYTPTAEDKLWLLRSVAREGHPRREVAKTLVNLFVLRRSRGSQESLTDLVRAYSKPVNPLWYPEGEKHVAAIQGLSVEARQKELTTAANRKYVYSTRTTFDNDTLAAVDEALRTGWSLDWTDFAAPEVKSKLEQRTEPRPHYNTFWSRAPGWPGYSVIGGKLVPK